MEYLFDINPKRYEGFNTECAFFKQHYTFNKVDGVYEKVTYGHCGLNDKLVCKDCVCFKEKSKVTEEEICAEKQMLLAHIKNQMEWTEKILQEFFNFEKEKPEEKKEIGDKIETPKVKPKNIFFD